MGISKKKKKEKKRKEKEAAFFCLMNRSGRLEKKNQIERRAESIARTEAGAELDCASPFDSIRFLWNVWGTPVWGVAAPFPTSSPPPPPRIESATRVSCHGQRFDWARHRIPSLSIFIELGKMASSIEFGSMSVGNDLEEYKLRHKI